MYKPPKTILSSLFSIYLLIWFDSIGTREKNGTQYGICQVKSQDMIEKRWDMWWLAIKAWIYILLLLSRIYLRNHQQHIILFNIGKFIRTPVQYWSSLSLKALLTGQRACLPVKKNKGNTYMNTHTHLSGYLSTHDRACREVKVKKKEWEGTMSVYSTLKLNSLWILNTYLLGKKIPIQFLSIPQSKQPGSRI